MNTIEKSKKRKFNNFACLESSSFKRKFDGIQKIHDLQDIDRKLDMMLGKSLQDIPNKVLSIDNLVIKINSEWNGNGKGWTLRISGELCDAKQKKEVYPFSKADDIFSSFLNSIRVLIIGWDEIDQDKDNYETVFHWNSDDEENDIFEIFIDQNRNASRKCFLRIILEPKHSSGFVKVEKRLDNLLGIQIDHVSRIIMAFWEYIKRNELHDASNYNYINCNPELKKLFGCQRFSLAELKSMLKPFLKTPDSSMIDYVLDKDEDEDKDKEKKIVMIVEGRAASDFDDFDFKDARKIGEKNKYKINELDTKIEKLAKKINFSCKKISCLEKFIEEPIATIKVYLEEDSKDIKIEKNVLEKLSSSIPDQSSGISQQPSLKNIRDYLFSTTQ